jgi:hypothetical protein
MPSLVRKSKGLLWRDEFYDMTTLADGARYDCAYGRAGDYRCKHDSFVQQMRRWARAHDCVVRHEPLFEDGAEFREQVGVAIQFFWDLRNGDPVPARFRDVDDDYVPRSGVEGWGPQTRGAFAHFPYDAP